MSATIKGFLNASISGITFGLIPLFAIPVLSTGMHSTSVLIYRYAFGCLAMLGMLMFHRTRMWLAFGDFLRILFLSLMYSASSITLIEGYNYMASGIATTLLFSYPVWTCLLSVVFCTNAICNHSHFYCNCSCWLCFSFQEYSMVVAV